MPASLVPFLGESMVVRYVKAAVADVVFIRGIFEASDGVAGVFSEKGGDLWVAACASRERELDELLADLQRELPSSLELQDAPRFSP